MLTYPEISPIALKLGPVAIHWYGIMYAIGFIGGWALLRMRIKRFQLDWTADQLSDLVLYSTTGKR